MTRLNRQIKSPEEVKKIIKACQIGDLAFEYIIKELKVGRTEKEIASLITKFIYKKGCRLSFRPIVSFGKNASEVHHKPNDTKLKSNHGFVMIDMGVKVDGYCSDMTRTLFVSQASVKQRKIYQTVKEAQKKSIDYIISSIKNNRHIYAKKVDAAAREYIIKKGYPAIPHSVGHGIGRKVHESPKISPKSKTEIKNGMVFTIEPGIYLPRFGGVRIEDVVLYKNSGPEILTKSSSSLMQL